MVETLDQNILEDKQEDSARYRQFARKEWKMSVSKLLAGLFVGLIILGSGIIIVNNGMIWGFLLLPFGLWVTASVILGGLGPSIWYRLRGYRNLPWGWISWFKSEDENTKEENEKAPESIEGRRESDETRGEREKTGFD